MRASLLALTALLLAACTGPAAGPAASDDPAETLRRLEQRLADADYVAVRATLLRIPPEEDWVTQLDAALWLGPNRRARIESSGQVNGLGAAPGLVADGTTVLGGRWGVHTDVVDFDAPVPAALRDWLAAGFVRRGLAYPLLHAVTGTAPDLGVETGQPGDPGARLVPYDPAWGVPEVIDGRTARPLTFTLALYAGSEAQVTLWLDAETGLPLRRRERIAAEAGPTTTDESYTDWSFAPPSDTLFIRPE